MVPLYLWVRNLNLECKGLSQTTGTFQNGEHRLLFSSKQVQYIRCWLHAVGLTKDLIPLPYSECLLTVPQDLRLVSRVTYKDGGALRGAIKVKTYD